MTTQYLSKKREPTSKPINLRPGTPMCMQKNEIEKIIEDLLNQSIIRPSKSPFAAPALLVKKKDGVTFFFKHTQLN